MKSLFFTLCISIIVAITYLVYSKKIECKNKLQTAIFKFILRGIAITFLVIFLVIVSIFTLDFGITHLLCFISSCAAIYLIDYIIFFGILGNKNIDNDFDFIAIIIIIGLILFIVPGICFLTLNFDTSSKELPKKEIILKDYSSEEKNLNEKITIIELSENNNDTKSFTIQTYNSDIELPFYDDYIDEYEIIENEKNKIVISTKEHTSIDLLTLFELKEPDVSQTQTYTLYINSKDILYN